MDLILVRGVPSRESRCNTGMAWHVHTHRLAPGKGKNQMFALSIFISSKTRRLREIALLSNPV
jgi:hypothetical protein